MHAALLSNHQQDRGDDDHDDHDYHITITSPTIIGKTFDQIVNITIAQLVKTFSNQDTKAG